MFRKGMISLMGMLLVLALPVLGQEKKPESQTHDHGQQAESAPGMDAMMQAWAAAGTPGDAHKHLASMAGTWQVDGKFWMGPGDPMVAKGTATRSMMLGGRVLAENFESEFMGQKFVGHGMTGYDNQKKTYWSSWNDTMMTGIMLAEGVCTDDGTTCTFMGSHDDPMMGRTVHMKMVGRSLGADKEQWESFMVMPDGSEMKTMELVYTRKK